MLKNNLFSFNFSAFFINSVKLSSRFSGKLSRLSRCIGIGSLRSSLALNFFRSEVFSSFFLVFLHLVIEFISFFLVFKFFKFVISCLNLNLNSI